MLFEQYCIIPSLSLIISAPQEGHLVGKTNCGNSLSLLVNSTLTTFGIMSAAFFTQT